MDQKHRKSLLLNRLAFTEDLEAKDVTGYLYQDGVLTQNDIDRVKAEKTRLERTELLLDILPRKGRKAYAAFRRALLSAEYQHLAKLTDEPQKEERAAIDCVDGDCVDGPRPSSVQHVTRSTTYPMKQSPRGWCLIINNVTFLDYTLSDRLGSDVDCSRLENLFRGMDYTTWTVNNAIARGMIAACKKLSEERCSVNCDCVVVCVLSHGSSKGIYGVDGDIVTIDDLLAPLTSNQMLSDVPKVFVIQSCRADTEAVSVDKPESGDVNDSRKTTEKSFEVIRNLGSAESQAARPDTSMFAPLNSTLANRQRHLVLAFCAFPGSVAYRNTDHGSWYIEALADVFEKESSSKSILDMLVAVNHSLSLKMSERVEAFQVPAPLFTLDKTLILNPRYL